MTHGLVLNAVVANLVLLVWINCLHHILWSRCGFRTRGMDSQRCTLAWPTASQRSSSQRSGVNTVTGSFFQQGFFGLYRGCAVNMLLIAPEKASHTELKWWNCEAGDPAGSQRLLPAQVHKTWWKTSRHGGFLKDDISLKKLAKVLLLVHQLLVWGPFVITVLDCQMMLEL